MELTFHVATAKDAAEIQRLVQSSFRAMDTRTEWTGHAELAANFKVSVEEVLATLAREDTVTLNAVTCGGGDDSEVLVATIDVSKRGSDTGHLSMIAVDESFQQAGVGRQVLRYAEEYCRKTWGVTRFTLNALSTRPALIDWYMRRGYQKTGGTTAFPRDRFPGLELPASMCFVDLEKALG